MTNGESALLISKSSAISQSPAGAAVTLLAPAALAEDIRRRLGPRGKGGYLRYLLARYRSEFEHLRKDIELSDRTVYQAPGLNLIRISLRPLWGDWIELSVLARSLGCSRCKLFVWLCEMDLEREAASGENVGVPTNTVKERLFQEASSVLLIEEVFPGQRQHKRRLEIHRDERLYIQLVHGPLAAAKYELTGVLDTNYSFNFHDFWPNFRKGERP